MKKSIIVKIEGGLLEAVYCNFIDDNIDVEIMDIDAEINSDDTSEYNDTLLEKIKTDKYAQIY